MYKVVIKKYKQPEITVRELIQEAHGLDGIPIDASIFVKPNLVFWTRHTDFPKWGMLTTSRVIEDIVKFLFELGYRDITLGEGMVTTDPKDIETPKDAFEKLGYNILKKKYGLKILNIFECPFEEIDLGDGVSANFNTNILHSDFIINVPVLKTHSQCVVSLGIKNLKGMIGINSRKDFHGTDIAKNLDFKVAKLANKMPLSFTIIDGIYTLERGPTFEGLAHRSNILVASRDMLAADLVGAKLLGFDPFEVPYLVHAAHDQNRMMDFSDIDIIGEKIPDLAKHHEWRHSWNEDKTLPEAFSKMGMKGIRYYEYDDTICTYCSGLTGMILAMINYYWRTHGKKPFDNIEVLTGKRMISGGNAKKTLVVGKCMYQKNRYDPTINDLIAIKGCPPSLKTVQEALNEVGIILPQEYYDNLNKGPWYAFGKYKGRPEFELEHHQIHI